MVNKLISLYRFNTIANLRISRPVADDKENQLNRKNSQFFLNWCKNINACKNDLLGKIATVYANQINQYQRVNYSIKGQKQLYSCLQNYAILLVFVMFGIFINLNTM